MFAVGCCVGVRLCCAFECVSRARDIVFLTAESVTVTGIEPLTWLGVQLKFPEVPHKNPISSQTHPHTHCWAPRLK